MTEPVLPNFFVIGAMKGGTTALHVWLARHPEVFMSRHKELHFFTHPQMYPDGVAGYAKHFEGAGDYPVRGESSATYTFWPMAQDVPAQMKRLVPEARFVYCVRDPIARMRSNYLHLVANGKESRPIDVALLEDERFLAISSYATQLDRYLEHFDAGRLHVVPSESLRSVDRPTLDGICRHLGVDPGLLSRDLEERVHETSDKRRVRPWAAGLHARLGGRASWLTTTAVEGEMSETTRDVLRERLRPEVERLRPWLPAGHDGWGLL